MSESIILETNYKKLLSYFVDSVKKNANKTDIVEDVFNQAVTDYIDDKIDESTLSSLAHLIYFKISDPSSIHNWSNSSMTSLIADIHELGYLHSISGNDEKARKSEIKLTDKIREYYESIRQ